MYTVTNYTNGIAQSTETFTSLTDAYDELSRCNYLHEYLQEAEPTTVKAANVVCLRHTVDTPTGPVDVIYATFSTKEPFKA